jgi:hypothetical protein
MPATPTPGAEISGLGDPMPASGMLSLLWMGLWLFLGTGLLATGFPEGAGEPLGDLPPRNVRLASGLGAIACFLAAFVPFVPGLMAMIGPVVYLTPLAVVALLGGILVYGVVTNLGDGVGREDLIALGGGVLVIAGAVFMIGVLLANGGRP